MLYQEKHLEENLLGGTAASFQLWCDAPYHFHATVTQVKNIFQSVATRSSREKEDGQGMESLNQGTVLALLTLSILQEIPRNQPRTEAKERQMLPPSFLVELKAKGVEGRSYLEHLTGSLTLIHPGNFLSFRKGRCVKRLLSHQRTLLLLWTTTVISEHQQVLWCPISFKILWRRPAHLHMQWSSLHKRYPKVREPGCFIIGSTLTLCLEGGTVSISQVAAQTSLRRSSRTKGPSFSLRRHALTQETRGEWSLGIVSLCTLRIFTPPNVLGIWIISPFYR